MTEYKVHMRYYDQHGLHDVTEWVESSTNDRAADEALLRVKDQRGVSAYVVNVTWQKTSDDA